MPAYVPGVYANTSSWITTLVASKGEERCLEVFPFLLVYRDRTSQRVEEYFTARPTDQGEGTHAVLETPDSVTPLRTLYGCSELKP